MKLHQKIGAGFALFCALMFGWAIITPSNPDHVLCLLIHGILTPMFLFSITKTVGVGGAIQVLALMIGSILTAIAGDFQPASSVGAMAVILVYAYSGFRSINIYVIIPVSLGQFALTFFAAVVNGFPMILSLGHAIAWTSFSLVAVWVVWIVFQQFAKDIVSQNRDLLDLSKKLKGECQDVATKRG